MFLYDFMYVDLPPDSVRRRLDGDGGADIVARAARTHDPAASTVVHLGEPLQLGGTTLFPLVWRAAPGGGPLLAAADLELAPMGADRTQLTLLGRAAVPDRGPDAGRRHVVQAMMRSFLAHLAHDLEHPAGVGEAPRRLPLAG